MISLSPLSASSPWTRYRLTSRDLVLSPRILLITTSTHLPSPDRVSIASALLIAKKTEKKKTLIIISFVNCSSQQPFAAAPDNVCCCRPHTNCSTHFSASQTLVCYYSQPNYTTLWPDNRDNAMHIMIDNKGLSSSPFFLVQKLDFISFHSVLGWSSRITFRKFHRQTV